MAALKIIISVFLRINLLNSSLLQNITIHLPLQYPFSVEYFLFAMFWSIKFCFFTIETFFGYIPYIPNKIFHGA